MHYTEHTAYLEKGVQIMVHPTYSPDEALSDFWLFPKLESLHRKLLKLNAVLRAANVFFVCIPPAEFLKTF